MQTDATEVTREIDLPAEPDEVWDALTRPELLEQWLADDVEIEPWDGGGIEVATEEGEHRRGVVERAERPERLIIHWWEVRPDDSTRVEFLVVGLPAGGSRLKVTETRTTLPMAAAHGWTTRLGSLRACLVHAVA